MQCLLDGKSVSDAWPLVVVSCSLMEQRRKTNLDVFVFNRFHCSIRCAKTRNLDASFLNSNTASCSLMS